MCTCSRIDIHLHILILLVLYSFAGLSMVSRLCPNDNSQQVTQEHDVTDYVCVCVGGGGNGDNMGLG